MKKKAVIEVQFNWIFILIIGAIILLFFFGIVRQQKEVSEKKISITVKRDIRAILTGAGVSTGTASLIEVPKTQIDFDCEGYSIQKTSPIKPVVSFSPDSMYDIKLILWALDWNIGFRVTNFLYITSPNTRYVLVFKSDDLQQHTFVDIINETLPSRYIEEKEERKILMNKEIIKLTDDPTNNLFDLENNAFEDKNNYKVRFVFFDEDPTKADISALKGMQDEDVTAIKIEPDNSCDNNLDCFGEIKFYKKNENVFGSPDGTSNYIKLPSLLGAIFSDLETYNCNMENAFERLQLVTEIYLNKTRVLKEYYKEPYSPCFTIMYEIENILDDIKNEVDDILSDFDGEFDVEDIYTYIQDLEDYNDRAIKLSCAEIY